MPKTDAQLRNDVQQELASDPEVNATWIAVNVNEGALALLGTVNTYAEKFSAERAAKRVRGVRTITLDLYRESGGRLDHPRRASQLELSVRSAEQTMRRLTGFVGVFNSISIQPERPASDVKAKVSCLAAGKRREHDPRRRFWQHSDA